MSARDLLPPTPSDPGAVFAGKVARVNADGTVGVTLNAYGDTHEWPPARWLAAGDPPSRGDAALVLIDDSGSVWATASTIATGAYALKPPTIPRSQYMFVAETGGDDTNDGLSLGSAKKEIGPAIAALVDGGVIDVSPGSYRPTTTLRPDGHAIVSQTAVQGGTGVSAKTTILHQFDGPLFEFVNEGAGLLGGRLAGFYLAQMGNFTGAAIRAVGTTAARVGGIYIDDVTVSHGDGINGFERDLDIDGSADATAGGPGIRQVFCTNCQFFGGKTAGETVRLNRVIHAYFRSCNIIQAPEVGVVQGLKVLHAESEDVIWDGYVLGGVSSAAAAGGVIVGPLVHGDLVWETGSANNQSHGHVTGAKTNNGATSNQWGLDGNAFAQAITFANGVMGPAGGRLKIMGAATAGLAEVWDRLSVSSSHGFGTFPDAGTGGLYLDGQAQINGALNHDGSTAGFYGTAPVAKQTGVPVTAAAVHAALVALGLISA